MFFMQTSLFNMKPPAIKAIRASLEVQEVSAPTAGMGPESATAKVFYDETDAPWLIKSAFHKELRKEDQRFGGLTAAWLQKITGAAGLCRYISGIVFEESRNIRLYSDIVERKLTPEIMAMRFLATRKKHRLPGATARFEQYLLAFRDAKTFTYAPTSDEVSRAIVSKDIYSMYLIFWRNLLRKENGNDSYKEAIIPVLRNIPDPDIQRYLDVGFDSFYGLKVCFEIQAGYYHPQWLEESPLLPFPGTDGPVPYMEWYVLDIHTRDGKFYHSKYIDELKPGKRPPVQIDSRYSGMLRGVIWRYYAVSNHLAKWEDIEIPSDMWKLACEMDIFFYSFFQKRI